MFSRCFRKGQARSIILLTMPLANTDINVIGSIRLTRQPGKHRVFFARVSGRSMQNYRDMRHPMEHCVR